MIKKILVLILTSFFINSSAFAMSFFLEPADITQFLKDQIAKAKFGKEVQVYDPDIINGIGMGIKARYATEPSYVDQYYTRLDQYTLTTNANIGTLLGTDLTPFGFSLSKGSEITFARQFKSQLDSVTAIPYTPAQIPFTVEKMNKLKTGDFVGFTTTLNLIANITTVLPASQIDLSLGAYALIQGQFMIHLFKINEHHFRLKIIAVRTLAKGGNARIGLIENKVVARAKQISVIGGELAGLVDITPFVFNAEKGKSNLVIFDYVFNINDPRAVLAYNNFSIKKVIFKDATSINPFKDFDKVDDYVMTDLIEIDKIVAEDKAKPQSERAIDRIFSAENSIYSESKNFNVKFNLIDFKNGSTYTQNKIKTTDRYNNKANFLFDSLSTSTEISLFFSLLGFENHMSANLVFKANDNFEPVEFNNLMFSREIKIKQLSKKRYERIKEHVRRVLPVSIFNKIVWANIDFKKPEAIVNSYFKNQIIFTLESLIACPMLSTEEVYSIIMELLKQFPRAPRGIIAKNNDHNDFVTQSISNNDWRESAKEDILLTSKKISEFLNKNLTNLERYYAFMAVKDSVIWRNIAVKFLLTILPEEAIQNTVRYDLIFEAKNAPPTRFKYGSAVEDSELFKNLMYIQSIIGNRAFDLRLYTSDNGELFFQK